MDQISTGVENQPASPIQDSHIQYAQIRFMGSEWKDWLQGQITNDIRLLTPESPLAFCVCKPTGQMLAPATLVQEGDHGNVFLPSTCVETVLARVEQMVILEDCTAELVDGYTAIVAFPLHEAEPMWGIDMTEANFPAEMGPAFEAKVMSYTKGCYTGQEVNHRLHSRGHTNKTWGIYVSETPLEPGIPVVDEDGNKVGAVTRCEPHNSGQWLVGAFVKNGTTPTIPPYKP